MLYRFQKTKLTYETRDIIICYYNKELRTDYLFLSVHSSAFEMLLAEIGSNCPLLQKWITMLHE